MARRRKAGGALTLSELEARLEDGDVQPLYLVVGEEPYLRSRALAALRRAVLGDGDEGDLGLERLDGSEVRTADVVDAARSMGLFDAAGDGPTRLVVVRRFDAARIDDAEALGAYLDDPSPSTCLVLEAERIDKRYAASKALAKAAVEVDCEPPGVVAHVKRWIVAEVEAAGCRIEPDAVDYLVEMVARDTDKPKDRYRLQPLVPEIEKAVRHLGGSGTITVPQLERLLGQSREHSVFELTRRLVAGDAQGAVELLNHVLDEGQMPLQIIGAVAWILRQLVIAQGAASSGKPRRESLREIGGPWDQRGEILDRGRRCSAEALTAALAACARADLEVKKLGGGPAVRGILEDLCRHICRAR